MKYEVENEMYDYQDRINDFYPADRSERRDRAGTYEETIEACLGLAGESGEVVDLIKKTIYYGKPLDRKKLAEELGDTLHYLTRLCELNGFDVMDIAAGNIHKLEKRYKSGYSDGAAIAQGERDV